MYREEGQNMLRIWCSVLGAAFQGHIDNLDNGQTRAALASRIENVRKV